jgi:hypothetical protein
MIAYICRNSYTGAPAPPKPDMAKARHLFQIWKSAFRVLPEQGRLCFFLLLKSSTRCPRGFSAGFARSPGLPVLMKTRTGSGTVKVVRKPDQLHYNTFFVYLKVKLAIYSRFF